MVFNIGPRMGGFGMMGNIMTLMFFVVFIGVAITFVVVIAKMLGSSAKNYSSPVLTVNAQIIGKRADVRNGHTWYYVTFQVESGDRMEYNVLSPEFGMLAENDAGRLTFQGGKYLGFERFIGQRQNREQ